MSVQLLVNLRVFREAFEMERYIGTDHIFALVRSGSFCFSANGAPFVTVNPNEGVLFRKDVLYKRKIITPVTMYLFRFRADHPIFTQDKITFSDTARIESTLALLEKLDTGIIKEEFALRCALFEDILTQYAIENALSSDGKSRKNMQIEGAIAQISENVHKKISLAEIGESTGLSYVQFIRRFKQHTGLTPSEYVAVLRLQKAKLLLLQTALPIKEIAYTCGFENEYYFSNFFKKHTNSSPSAFRNSML